MRCLVTGGAGFIGSNLVDALVNRGDHVEIVDDLSTGDIRNLDSATQAGAVLWQADVRDRDALMCVAAALSPDVIFHLAARIDVRSSVSDPAGDLDVNVAGTINVLDAAVSVGAHVVLSSTGGAVYGDTDQVPTPETHPARPQAPYGLSKFTAENYLALYGRLHGLRTTTLRYANVYGPRQNPLGEGGVIAIFTRKARLAESAVIFGDGQQTRDFVHVSDVVRANLAAAARPEVSGPLNIGTGRETTLLDLTQAFADLGFPVSVTHEPERAGEVRRSALDCRQAAQQLGWQARAGLHEGLSDTLGPVHLHAA